MAKDKQTVLEKARKSVSLERDNLGRRTTVEISKIMNIGGIIPVVPPHGFDVWYSKADGEPGRWLGSFYQTWHGWNWLENNALIFQLPTGGRITSDHGKSFVSNVISGGGGKVSEKKVFYLDEVIDELVVCFDQDKPIEVRLGIWDFVIAPTFLAYVVALKELVDANNL